MSGKLGQLMRALNFAVERYSARQRLLAAMKDRKSGSQSQVMSYANGHRRKDVSR